MINLRQGVWAATVAPEVGGAVAGLTYNGAPILRPTPPGASDVLAFGCFPLIPYANRIAQGRFAFDGEEVRVGATPRFEPHALHGDGWLAAWTVENSDDRAVTMRLLSDGGVWPWPYEARQTFVLDEGLTATLSIRNTGARAMPGGLGFHPYFVRTGDTIMTLDAAEVWLTGPDLIPERCAPAVELIDWRQGRRMVEAPFVDNAYGGWTGSARLSQPAGTILLKASSNARWVQIYAPLDADFYCVEPMTHRPDAVNASMDEDAGITRLEHGESLTLTMRISVL